MSNSEDVWRMLDEADLVCSADEVDEAIRRVGAEISDVLSDSYPLVLAVMGGAVVFAGRLLPLLRFPLAFDFIHVTRYGASTAGAEVDWRVAPQETVKDRAVLVLDDILDRGETMAAIRDRIITLGAKSFHCAVLTEKALPDPKPIKPDFVGLNVPDRFVFGCGMDARGHWRNLPEIYALKGG